MRPCLVKPFKASKIRSGYCYDDSSRKLILTFKHADRLDIAPVMAVKIAAPFDALAETADIINLLNWRAGFAGTVQRG